MAKIEILTATIGSGQSMSAAIDLGDRVLMGVQTDPNWTQAKLAFYCSHDGVTFARMRLNNGTVNTPGDQNGNDYAALHEFGDVWKGVRWIKIQSGGHGAPVNQVSSVTLYLFTRSDTPVLSISC